MGPIGMPAPQRQSGNLTKSFNRNALLLAMQGYESDESDVSMEVDVSTCKTRSAAGTLPAHAKDSAMPMHSTPARAESSRGASAILPSFASMDEGALELFKPFALNVRSPTGPWTDPSDEGEVPLARSTSVGFLAPNDSSMVSQTSLHGFQSDPESSSSASSSLVRRDVRSNNGPDREDESRSERDSARGPVAFLQRMGDDWVDWECTDEVPRRSVANGRLDHLGLLDTTMQLLKLLHRHPEDLGRSSEARMILELMGRYIDVFDIDAIDELKACKAGALKAPSSIEAKGSIFRLAAPIVAQYRKMRAAEPENDRLEETW